MEYDADLINSHYLQLRLVSARPDTVFHRGGLEILLRNVGVVHPLSIFLAPTIPFKWIAQGRIIPQLGDQVQSALPHHLKSWIVTKMAIQSEVNRVQQWAEVHEQRYNHLLNAL